MKEYSVYKDNGGESYSMVGSFSTLKQAKACAEAQIGCDCCQAIVIYDHETVFRVRDEGFFARVEAFYENYENI